MLFKSNSAHNIPVATYSSLLPPFKCIQFNGGFHPEWRGDVIGEWGPATASPFHRQDQLGRHSQLSGALYACISCTLEAIWSSVSCLLGLAGGKKKQSYLSEALPAGAGLTREKISTGPAH